MRDITASSVSGHAFGRHLSIFRHSCGFPSVSGLPRQWLQTRARRTRRPASTGADNEADSEGGGDSDGPMSLAALSRAQSQRKLGHVAQRQQRSRQPGAPYSRSPPLPPQTRKSDHGQLTLHTNRLEGFEPASPSQHSSRLCPPPPAIAAFTRRQQTPSPGAPSVATPLAAVAAEAAGSAVPPADLQRDFQPGTPRIPNLDPEPAEPAPEPRHPPVAFRNVAELRLMLQARQAVAGQAVAVVATTVIDTLAAATARPAPWLPQRVFGSIPVASDDLSPAPTADHTTTCEMSIDSLASSRGIEVDVAPGHAKAVAAPGPADGAATAAASILRPGSQQATGNDSGGDGFAAGRPEVILDLRQIQRDGDGEPVRAMEVLAATAMTTAMTTEVATASHPSAAALAGLSLKRMGPPASLPVKSKIEQQDEAYEKAKLYALSLLQRSPLPTSELARRLLARGHPRQAVEPLLTWLAEGGALNDRIYARLFAASKWNSNLMAPSKIKQELMAQGVSMADVAAALTHVFGPSQRIQLRGAGTPEELAVRDALLDAARRHVERQSGAAISGAEQVSNHISKSRSTTPSASLEADEPFNSSSGRREKSTVRKHSSVETSRWGTSRSSAAGWGAKAKEQNAKRRRLAMWLQYRGHEMDVVLKVFDLLKV
ncbi:hypothetical protein VaNZ11_014263 [Volvox africanus]|uniref:Regulatory protein RecX n=1 Tax=Volvox africanus TaxID=51714 RepID=A0ABQ5SI14_9CHLO|nr:hypothetical protein VaNZ11_014263 [Volvox africanus]